MVTKKRIFSFLVCCLFVFSFSLNALAAMPSTETLVHQYIETYSDDSYAVISVYQDFPITRSGTVVGHKDYAYYDAGLAWTFTVHGTFSFTGSSSSCQAASYTYSISNNVWYCTNANAWPDGNTANASGTMRRGSDGFLVFPNVTLSCTASGSLY